MCEDGGGRGSQGGIDGQGQDTHCNDITKDTKTEKITKKYVLKQGRTNTSKFKICAHRMMTQVVIITKYRVAAINPEFFSSYF